MSKTEKNWGYAEGEVCNRRLCNGTIAVHDSENCSCHIAPPCSSCTAPRSYCPVCDWHESEDIVMNDFVTSVNRHDGTYRDWAPRPLDNTKIDYHTKSHTHFSQIHEGVYPPGTTREEVLAKVKGTFGGRFEQFGNGKFKYVAYTD